MTKIWILVLFLWNDAGGVAVEKFPMPNEDFCTRAGEKLHASVGGSAGITYACFELNRQDYLS